MSTLPERERRNATGKRTISCLLTDTIILIMGLPIAWNTEPAIILKPARIKWDAIILNAVAPMDNIFSEALNIESKVRGKIWNAAKPTIIIITAVITVVLTVLFTLSDFFAP